MTLRHRWRSVVFMTRLALTSIFLSATILFAGHLALLFSKIYEHRLVLLHLLLLLCLAAFFYLTVKLLLELADRRIDKGWRPRKGWWLDPLLLSLTAIRYVVHHGDSSSSADNTLDLSCSWLENFVKLLPIEESPWWTALTWSVIAHNLWHLVIYLRYRYRNRGDRLP